MSSLKYLSFHSFCFLYIYHYDYKLALTCTWQNSRTSSLIRSLWISTPTSWPSPALHVLHSGFFCKGHNTHTTRWCGFTFSIIVLQNYHLLHIYPSRTIACTAPRVQLQGGITRAQLGVWFYIYLVSFLQNYQQLHVYLSCATPRATTPATTLIFFKYSNMLKIL